MKHTNLYEISPDEFLPGPEVDDAWKALKSNPNGDTTNNMRLALLAGYDRLGFTNSGPISNTQGTVISLSPLTLFAPNVKMTV